MSIGTPDKRIESVATTHQEAQFSVLSENVASEEARKLRGELARLPEEQRAHMRPGDLEQAISNLAGEISTTWTSPHPIRNMEEYERQTQAIAPKLDKMHDLEIRAATINKHRRNLAVIPAKHASAEVKQEWTTSYMQKRVLEELATLQNEPTEISKMAVRANPAVLLAAAVTSSYRPKNKEPRELLEQWILKECKGMDDNTVAIYVTMALRDGYLPMSPEGPIKTREELIRRVTKAQVEVAVK